MREQGGQEVLEALSKWPEIVIMSRRLRLACEDNQFPDPDLVWDLVVALFEYQEALDGISSISLSYQRPPA